MVVTGERHRTWELKMEGPQGAPERYVTGDVDFLGLFEPDGGLIRDPKKRLQIYEELAVPGRFFEAGDLVVLDPGGSSQEYAVLAGVNPTTLAGPLTFDHENGEVVALVEIGMRDTDGDGLADTQEQEWFTNPAVRDTDADGIADGAEVSAGFDPASAISNLRILSVEREPTVGATQIRVHWASVPGKFYSLEVAFCP